LQEPSKQANEDASIRCIKASNKGNAYNWPSQALSFIS